MGPIDTTSALKSGWLEKYGGWLCKSWKRRYVVLYGDGELYVYETSTSRSVDSRIPLRTSDSKIELGSRNWGIPLPSTSNSRDAGFSLQSKGTRYYFFSLSDQEASEWVQALHEARRPNITNLNNLPLMAPPPAIFTGYQQDTFAREAPPSYSLNNASAPYGPVPLPPPPTANAYHKPYPPPQPMVYGQPQPIIYAPQPQMQYAAAAQPQSSGLGMGSVFLGAAGGTLAGMATANLLSSAFSHDSHHGHDYGRDHAVNYTENYYVNNYNSEPGHFYDQGSDFNTGSFFDGGDSFGDW